MIMSDFRTSLPQILAVCIKNIILVAFGMSLGFPTVLIPALQAKPDPGNASLVISDDDKVSDSTDVHLILSESQISWISSINLIFVPLGCIFSGSFTYNLGRRKAMQWVCLPLFASWMIFFNAQHVYHLYFALCISGFAGGMLEAPVLTYVAEITTPKLRGILAATGSFCIILGIFSQFLMGLFLKWRTITLVSTIAPTLAVFFLFFVPESPHWLILKGKEEEAKKSLMWLRGWRKSFHHVRSEYDELHRNLSTRLNPGEDNKESVFKSFSRKTFLVPYFICSLAFFIGHFSGMTTLQTYAVPIFAQLHAPIDKYFATMLLGIVELIGTVICVMLVRFVGKRKLTFFSTLGCGLCFCTTALYSYYIKCIPDAISKNSVTMQIDNAANASLTQIIDSLVALTTTEVYSDDFVGQLSSTVIEANQTDSNDFDQRLNKYSWIPLTLLLGSALLSHSGIRLLPWMLIGEVFPAKIRGIASGFTGGTSYIFGFLANKLFLTMIAGLTLPGTFLLYSCVSAVGCLILFFVLPETEGKTLQEIEDHFSGKSKLTNSLKRIEKQIVEDNFPTKFNVGSWESNDKFEKSLQQHHINHVFMDGNTHSHTVDDAAIPVKKTTLSNESHLQNKPAKRIPPSNYGLVKQPAPTAPYNGVKLPNSPVIEISAPLSGTQLRGRQRVIVNDRNYDTPL